MYKTLSTLILLIICFQTKAQIKSDLLKFEDDMKYYSPTYQDKHYAQEDDVLFTMNRKKGNYIIQKHNLSTGNFDSKDLGEIGKFDFIDNLNFLNKKLYFFYAKFDKKTSTVDLRYKEIDQKSLKFVSDESLHTFNIKRSGFTGFSESLEGIKKSYNVMNSHFTFSENKSYFSIDNSSYNNLGKMTLITFDNNLQKIQEIKFDEFFTKKAHYSIKNLTVNSEGTNYIIYRAEKSPYAPSMGFEKEKISPYILLKIENNKVSEYKIPHSEYFYRNIKLKVDKNEIVYVSGIYNSKSSFHENSDGIFILKISNNLKLIDKKYEPFKSDEIKNLYLDTIEIIENGIILISEESKYVYGGSSPTLYYNDIVIMKFSLDLSLIWSKIIPKWQFGGGSKGPLSYKYFNDNNKHHFFFIDSPKNDNLKDGKLIVFNSGTEGVLRCYSIDDEGGFTKKMKIFNFENYNKENKTDYHFVATKTIFKFNNQFFFESYNKGKKSAFIIFEL